MTYYNEFDPKAAAWLRELIRAGHIPAGHVDERSISDIRPDELTGYRQQHFFAGIGGWALALRLAGWPDERPVRTGSCPCQPFSAAGKGLGEADERHLWPVFRDLITFGEPTVTFGEQVASAPGRIWLARVRADLEGLGYGVGAADLCSAGVGSPNIRQRLFWMAYAGASRRGALQRTAGANWGPSFEPYRHSDACGMADMHGERCEERAQRDGKSFESEQQTSQRDDALRCGGPCGLAYTNGNGCAEHVDESGKRATAGPSHTAERCRSTERLGDTNDTRPQGRLERGHGADQRTPWSASVVLPCTDGKSRRIEPGSFPLAHGVSGRVGLLRGYGNAINPWLAAEFILACEEAIVTP